MERDGEEETIVIRVRRCSEEFDSYSTGKEHKKRGTRLWWKKDLGKKERTKPSGLFYDND